MVCTLVFPLRQFNLNLKFKLVIPDISKAGTIIPYVIYKCRKRIKKKPETPETAKVVLYVTGAILRQK